MATDTTAPPKAPTVPPARTSRRRPRGRAPFPVAFYLMVLPALILFFIFHTIPVIQGIYYSFTDSPGYGPSNLVGFAQLHRAVH